MIAITPETIAGFCLCIIASFMVGFVAGISREYHTSKKAIQRQQENETKRLRGIAEMVHLPAQEVQP